MRFFVLLCFSIAHGETFSERHGKKADTSTFSGRHQAGASADVASPDSKTVWLGAQFGEKPLRDMRCETPEPAVPAFEECVRPDDAGDRRVGALRAKAVRYRYHDRELFEVSVDFPDPDAAEVVIRALGIKYGRPEVGGTYPTWEGSVMHVRTRALGQGLTLTYTDTNAAAHFWAALDEAGVDPAAGAAADL